MKKRGQERKYDLPLDHYIEFPPPTREEKYYVIKKLEDYNRNADADTLRAVWKFKKSANRNRHRDLPLQWYIDNPPNNASQKYEYVRVLLVFGRKDVAEALEKLWNINNRIVSHKEKTKLDFSDALRSFKADAEEKDARIRELEKELELLRRYCSE